MTDGLIPGTPHEWPAGHRAAVAILVNVEGPVAIATSGPLDTGSDYVATGMQRLLGVLEDLDTSVTTCWTENALNSLPQLVRRVADAGHEVAVTFDAETTAAQSSLVPAMQRVSGQPVQGARTGIRDADTTPFNWIIDGSGGDVPSIRGGTVASPTVQIPVSPYWNDRIWLHPDRPLPPSSLLEAWSTSLAAVRTDGTLMTVEIHPHIIMRPGFSGTFIRFLDEVIASGDVWLTRLDHLALWWSQHHVNS
jgi:hypothetical protein